MDRAGGTPGCGHTRCEEKTLLAQTKMEENYIEDAKDRGLTDHTDVTPGRGHGGAVRTAMGSGILSEILRRNIPSVARFRHGGGYAGGNSI